MTATFGLADLAGLCQARNLTADIHVRCQEWEIVAHLGDDVELRIHGFGSSALDADSGPLVTAWDREYLVDVPEAAALLSGQIDVRQWLDDMEEAARLLSEAEDYREQLDAERVVS